MEQRDAKFIDIHQIQMVLNTRKGQFNALRDINLTVRNSEFVTWTGHSGCGKSTLLHLIVGLLMPSGGLLIYAGRKVSDPSSEPALLFKNHSLLPWQTC